MKNVLTLLECLHGRRLMTPSNRYQARVMSQRMSGRLCRSSAMRRRKVYLTYLPQDAYLKALMVLFREAMCHIPS